ncbi:MAG: NAD(P)H-dependent oxidoreductase [Verrucomicrobia bacterium]|nr:NAD(P)H-dependent oxidoreductase [Verrucomicrobiota bacterium]
MSEVRTGQGSTRLTKEEFLRRWNARFFDPAFDRVKEKVGELGNIAWEAYRDSRKSPRTREAGAEFAHPKQELSVEWLNTREKIREAQNHQQAKDAPSRILLICASPRTDETCPGEMSKTFRLAQCAREVISTAADFEVDFLDLSNLTAEYGRVIYPCKACVSTAMPLCHWPCSCYPNHAMAQVNDWMGELYPRWVAAHGVMIVTPVHWYESPSVLKLMMDRLVCADGGNPDPTTTHGKNPEEAKALELKGWNYPRHLAGRVFSAVVHGDTEGAGGLRQSLHDWLSDMRLIPADEQAITDTYIGYYEPYATSHDSLDRDKDFIEETKNAARMLMKAIGDVRSGKRRIDFGMKDPRPK